MPKTSFRKNSGALDQFIGLAEQYYRINDIGLWVIEMVLSQVA